jgi:hypothetical protein
VAVAPSCAGATVGGERKLCHPLSLTFDGPLTHELAAQNPFLDFRLEVTFTSPSGKRVVVPGYYAADGDAADSGATSGSRWRAHLTPDEIGRWTYEASFRSGPGVALGAEANAGTAATFDGAAGSFTIAGSDKSAPDHRARGLLQYVGENYLRFAGDGSYFLKGGADSPENFLGYEEFDGTFDTKGNFLHAFEPHLADWRAGEPTWSGGRGRGIIGALN